MTRSIGLKSRDNFQNASSNYKILVKFLDSLSAHALKVTIFKESALWANSFYKSKFAFVSLSVTLSHSV